MLLDNRSAYTFWGLRTSNRPGRGPLRASASEYDRIGTNGAACFFFLGLLAPSFLIGGQSGPLLNLNFAKTLLKGQSRHIFLSALMHCISTA
jgi:hypothetical protein